MERLHICNIQSVIAQHIDLSHNGLRACGKNNTINYTYATDGAKLRAEYNTTMSISTPINSSTSLPIEGSLANGGNLIIGGKPSGSNIQLSTTDYCANLIYTDKRLSTILFEGGYASVDANGHITMHYYVKDHLGSNRLVVDANGNIEEENHYYPFGALMGDSKNIKKNRFKYVGKELDRMYGVDMQDHGARHLDIVDTQWIVIDPLCYKYYSISPYVYGADNPINIYDSDGRKLRFAPGVSEQFKKDFACAVQYLKEHKADGILAKLEKLDIVIYISDANNLDGIDKSSYFSNNKNIIYWNSRQAFSTTNAVILSPTTILNHEADHALQAKTHYNKWVKEIQEDKKNPYESKEEERVITGSEQRTAKALGEIGEEEKTRDNHKSANTIITDGPTSVITNDSGVVIKP